MMETIMNGRNKIILLLLAFLLCIVSAVHGASVTLVWDANDPAPDGYRLYQRLDGQAYDYTAPIWQGSENMAVIEELDPGRTYFFVCRAYVEKSESGDSNEVNYTGVIQAPINLRIEFEISVYIDVNGQPIIAAMKNE